MHKLKNKHTGEVITTPYLAEAEEYLKSGDYEMSENKYPYICSDGFGQIVMLYGEDDAFHIEGKCKGEYSGCYNEFGAKNITREYLTNTYGKCESQDHADFICKLAVKHGFEYSPYDGREKCFWFDDETLAFYLSDDLAKIRCKKQISLPLPPKEKEIPEEKPMLKLVQNNATVYESENLTLKVKGLFFVEHETNTLYCGETVERLFNHSDAVKSIEVQNEKPVYTKEMHERGELPPVGSEVLTVSGVGVVRHHILAVAIGEQEFFIKSTDVNPPPTIEDELFDVTSRFIGREMTQADLVSELLDRYNITPK